MSREIVEVYADWHPIEQPVYVELLFCLHPCQNAYQK